MLAPVLESLAHLHGRGFVHGSLKPSNILVVEERLKLSTDHLLFPASEGAPSGSDDIHDAPELATGLVSPAADIWSLGVLLVEALTQKPPVWDESGESDPVVPQSLPQPYLGIASACLRRDPKDRRTLNGVRALLDPSQAPPASARKQPEPAAKNETAQPSRRSGVALPIAAAIVLLAAISLFLIRSHRGETRSSTGQESAQSDSQASSGSQAANESGAPKGEVVSRVLPDLLPEAKESIRGEFGLTVRVKVDPSGNVVDASLDQPGPSRYFASQSIEAARLWKFKPPQAAGHPVPSVWTLEFRFTQDGTEIVPVEVSP
jgi:TonB family protein